MVEQHDTEFLKRNWMDGMYPDNQVECRIRLKWLLGKTVRISFVDVLGNELVRYGPISLYKNDEVTIRNVRLIQRLIPQNEETKELIMAEGEEKNPVYEVLFTYDQKVSGSKSKTEQKVLGPFYYPAKNSLSATVQGILANYKELIKAKVTTIDPKVKRF